MTTKELMEMASLMRELALNDPMDEDQQTEFIGLAVDLSSWLDGQEFIIARIDK